ncbi:hypothetical protein EV356DRAFT_528995 [Viridothelium virens]|uniref:Uncharacterized protein n=1 Tax=Viridothelium virens TaxID=1048519 RepID=A0A6A6HL39_VIRVR|nr:hypothetical protein EV356DRAFT_528995 [Viridothelium virens]
MNKSDIVVTSGWQAQPDGRGTWDILKSCGGTVLLLCWSSVCPNVLAAEDSKFRKLRSKLSIFLLAILCPDLIFEFHEAGYESWSLRKCFFVNMGGFYLRAPDWKVDGRDSFAINAKQLLFLIKAGGITITQVLWFTFTTIGRAVQGLAMTTLELTTLGLIFMMTVASLCWWHKPMDVSAPIVLDLKVDLRTVLAEGNAPSDASEMAYMGTPLSFIGRHEWFYSRLWFYYTQMLRELGLAPKPCSPYQFDHFSSIDFHDPDVKAGSFAIPLVIIYGSIFMAAWKFHFPTEIEQTLWRISAIASSSLTAVSAFETLQNHSPELVASWFSCLLRCRNPSSNRSSTTERPPSKFIVMYHRLNESLDWLRNISPNRDPALHLRLRNFIPTSIMIFAYCLSRGYILAEDLASLRTLPESVFATLNWGRYSPIF